MSSRAVRVHWGSGAEFEGLERKGEELRSTAVWRPWGGQGARHGRLHAATRQLKGEGFPQPHLLSRDSPGTRLFCLSLFDGKQRVWPAPGPPPQGSCRWLKRREGVGDVQAPRRTPIPRTGDRSPMENSVTAECQGLYLSVPEIPISLLKKNTTHLANRQSGKNVPVEQISRMVAQNA